MCLIYSVSCLKNFIKVSNHEFYWKDNGKEYFSGSEDRCSVVSLYLQWKILGNCACLPKFLPSKFSHIAMALQKIQCLFVFYGCVCVCVYVCAHGCICNPFVCVLYSLKFARVKNSRLNNILEVSQEFQEVPLKN